MAGDFSGDFSLKSCSNETKELKEIFRNFVLKQLIDKVTRTAGAIAEYPGPAITCVGFCPRVPVHKSRFKGPNKEKTMVIPL